MIKYFIYIYIYIYISLYNNLNLIIHIKKIRLKIISERSNFQIFSKVIYNFKMSLRVKARK